jgi:hypothetical protein
MDTGGEIQPATMEVDRVDDVLLLRKPLAVTFTHSLLGASRLRTAHWYLR